MAIVNNYSSQSVPAAYNQSPPSDDGSQVAANQVEWAKHLSKIGDPLKLFAENINSAIDTALDDLVSQINTGLVASPVVGADVDETEVALLDTVNEWTAQQNYDKPVLTEQATIAWNLNDEPSAEVTITADRILGNATNPVDGGVYGLTFIQDGTGGWLITFDTKYDGGDIGLPDTSTMTANQEMETVWKYNANKDKFVFMGSNVV